MRHGLLNLLFFWSRLSDKYRKILAEGRADKSVYFGVRAIISMLFSVVLIVGIVAAVYYVLMLTDTLLVVFAIIIAVALGIGGLLAMLNGVIGSLVCVIYQLRLNRGPIGWVSLALWVVLLAALIAGVIMVLSMLGNI